MSLIPLDHIIHLSPPGKLNDTISHFKELGFEVFPGGTHADGLTENALVVLADGVYIELIQFTQPVSAYPEGSEARHKRETHWWASMKENGWIDFALGDLTEGAGSLVAEAINARARDEEDAANVRYDEGIEGGRVKPDGETIRWVVTFPSKSLTRGGVPFFCKDLTPRERRVPRLAPVAGTDTVINGHCQIGALTLKADKTKFQEYSTALRIALGRPGTVVDEGRAVWWPLGRPNGGDSPIVLRLVEQGEAGDIGVYGLSLETVGRRVDKSGDEGIVRIT